MSPRPWVAMKLMASGVTNWAASVRSPSFSRSSSSTRMIILPARMSLMAPAMRSVSFGSMARTRGSEFGGHQARHVARHEVHLQVDRLPRREGAELRLLDRLRDERYLEAV